MSAGRDELGRPPASTVARASDTSRSLPSIQGFLQRRLAGSESTGRGLAQAESLDAGAGVADDLGPQTPVKNGGHGPSPDPGDPAEASTRAAIAG